MINLIQRECPYRIPNVGLWLSQGLGGRGNGIYFRRTGKERPTFEGKRETKAILGNREHKKTNFRLGAEENAPLFHGNKGTGTPNTLGGPRECNVC